MRLAIHASLLASVLAGCLPSHSDDDSTDPQDPSDPSNPDPKPTPPPTATGTYHVRSQIDITVEALLPERAEQLVVTFRDFSTAPAHTLIDLAEDAGVPAVAELRAVLPDSLESRLEGWIDEEIAKVKLGGVPITQIAGEAAALAETTLTQVALESDLAITGGTTATHRLTALDFAPAGIDARLNLGAFPSDIVSATTTARSDRGTLALGDHGYSIAYGQYAWRAFEAACTAAHGTTIRQTLGAAVNCPNVAARIASKCIFSVCVGHATQLTELCERGLDEVVDRAAAKVASIRFDAIHLAAGTATIADNGSRLANGTWTAEINAGVGLRHVPATFAATR